MDNMALGYGHIVKIARRLSRCLASPEQPNDGLSFQ
jgi:hypothetical protein